MTELHPSIRNIQMPTRMARLPRTETGWPILFFAARIDGKLDLRVMDGVKRVLCIKRRLCWLCGQPLGVHMAFLIGPMCAVNRITAEPPSHRDCAEYATRACPFLARPNMRRNESGRPEEAINPGGVMLEHNPGAMAMWVTQSYKPFRAGTGDAGILIQLGPPSAVLWYAEGRTATRAEIDAAMTKGLPFLRDMAAKEGPEGVAALEKAVELSMALLPAA